MKKYRIYAPGTKKVTSLEKVNRILARRSAAEGMVLLKNNGALPLDSSEIIDLFGTGARWTVFGGSGSGETKGREKISVEKGLLNAGVSIGSTRWLDIFDKRYRKKRVKWKREVEESIKGYHLYNVIQMYEEIGKHPFLFPVGQPVVMNDISYESTTALYILARQAGEGKDREAKGGDYLLTEVEKESIRFLRKHYKKLIVVINSGASLDMEILDEVEIDALIFMGQPGEEAGNALADILLGKVSPSGHLTSTWAKQITDFPEAEHYAKNDKDHLEADYKEGIYVGYRYFDAMGIAPRFAFGYGLSYADFKVSFECVQQQKKEFICDFIVENISDTFPGAEVVQIYVSKPSDKIYQVNRELCGFEKTSVLSPGKTEKLSVHISFCDLKTYDEKINSYVLLEGEYRFFAGDSSDDALYIGKLIVQKNMEIQKLSIIAGTKRFEDLQMPQKGTEDGKGFILVINEAELERYDGKSTDEYFSNQAKANARMIASDLTDGELASLIVGADVTGAGYNRAPGAVGKTTNKLLKKYHIPNINMADGPAGINLLPENMITKRGMELAYEHLPEERTWGFLKKMEWISVGKKGRDIPVFQYTTAFPSTTVRAQSWNKKLDYEIGIAIGKEMKKFGITLWLAPALNVQRNPLCGRNFEYASEDPYLSGKMAAAITKGVQSVGGVGVTVKHFCANNQETEREWVSSNISVRAFREIYLRGFEIVVRDARPWAVMTSYNRLNGVYTGNHKELITNVLRGDFGFDGIVMTDWRAITNKKGDFAKCAPAGNDIIMPGEPYVEKAVKSAIIKGELSRDIARQSAERVLSVIFSSNVWRVE